MNHILTPSAIPNTINKIMQDTHTLKAMYMPFCEHLDSSPQHIGLYPTQVNKLISLVQH